MCGGRTEAGFSAKQFWQRNSGQENGEVKNCICGFNSIAPNSPASVLRKPTRSLEGNARLEMAFWGACG